MHLDTSFIVADPKRENKLYTKYRSERLLCIIEVADEVEKHYRSKRTANNKPLPEEKIQDLTQKSLDGISVIPHPHELESAVDFLEYVLLSIGHSKTYLKNNYVDMMVCCALILDHNETKLVARDSLITEISHIFSEDIILLPLLKPLGKNRESQINLNLRKYFWQEMPLNFWEIITGEWQNLNE